MFSSLCNFCSQSGRCFLGSSEILVFLPRRSCGNGFFPDGSTDSVLCEQEKRIGSFTLRNCGNTVFCRRVGKGAEKKIDLGRIFYGSE